MRNLALTVARRAAAAASSLRASAPGALRVAEATLPRSSSLGVAGFSAAAVSDAPVSSHRSVATVGGLFAASAAFAATANLAVAPPAEAKEAVPMAKLPFDKVTLYQYDVCPFCNKVKAMLDYHGVPYDVVEVNPLTKSEMKFSTEWKKVPILMIDDEQLNDSSAIMRAIEKRVGAKGAGSGWGGMSAAEKESEWLAWVDDRFVHVVTPNIYRTWGEAFRSFDYITERGNFNWAERQAVRVSGAVSMYLIAQNVLKKRHGIEDEREELYKCLRRWSEEAVGKQPFCGGDKPNLADLAVFGVMRAVKTFDTFEDGVAAVPEVGEWYRRMQKEVGVATRTDGIEN